jgi:pimeloyl-ACP methyl ester carboxylesterase
MMWYRVDRRILLRQLASSVMLASAGALARSRGALAQTVAPTPLRPSQAASGTPATITHRRIQTNGITMHVAEAGTGPLVVLLHGFPELWYSWRHQLPALAAAGYHAVAPDLRGYGGTDVPEAIEAYSMRNLTADVVGLLDAFGVQKAPLVGHDWGANIAWACAELYPERTGAVVALSVPYQPRLAAPPTQVFHQFSPATFNFAVYFQDPGVAEAELEADVRRSLRLFFYALSGDAPPDVVPYLFTAKPSTAGALDGMPDPDTLPAWLTDADLDYYTQAYSRTGFGGALGVYRNMDRDWEELPQLGTTGASQPAAFIGGRRDSAVLYGRFDPMESVVPNLRRIVLLPGCGHWTQQERSEDVTAELVDFLQRQAKT